MTADPPDPETELATLNRDVERLGAEVANAYEAWLAADGQLRAAVRRRDELGLWLHLQRTAAVPPGPVSVAPSPKPAPTGPEASTHTVQNVLFLLGGLLLGTAAIV